MLLGVPETLECSLEISSKYAPHAMMATYLTPRGTRRRTQAVKASFRLGCEVNRGLSAKGPGVGATGRENESRGAVVDTFNRLLFTKPDDGAHWCRRIEHVLRDS